MNKSTDERIKHLLAEISANELGNAESWSQRIEQLEENPAKKEGE